MKEYLIRRKDSYVNVESAQRTSEPIVKIDDSVVINVETKTG